MNHAVLSAHLENAENYVTKGEQYIGRLREIIDVLARSGSDATDAEGLLRQVEAVQEMYVSHREWLQVELKRSTGLIFGVHPNRKARANRTGILWTNKPNDPAADVPWSTSTKKKNQQWSSGS